MTKWWRHPCYIGILLWHFYFPIARTDSFGSFPPTLCDIFAQHCKNISSCWVIKIYVKHFSHVPISKYSVNRFCSIYSERLHVLKVFYAL